MSNRRSSREGSLLFPLNKVNSRNIKNILFVLKEELLNFAQIAQIELGAHLWEASEPVLYVKGIDLHSQISHCSFITILTRFTSCGGKKIIF